MTTHDTDTARDLARGICRFMTGLGYRTLTEFTFGNGRRADVLALNPQGDLAVVEIKSSLADLRADGKWPDYRPFCDRLWFGVPPGFPLDALPGDTGILVADRYGAAIERDPPHHKVHASRRRSVVLNFGLVAATRLHQQIDPDHTVGQPFT